jgi:hypothetical protein
LLPDTRNPKHTAAMSFGHVAGSGCCGVNYNREGADYLAVIAQNPLGSDCDSVGRGR